MTRRNGFLAALLVGIMSAYPTFAFAGLFVQELQLPVVGVVTVVAGLLAGSVTRGLIPALGLIVGFVGSWAVILAYYVLTLPQGDPGLGLFFGALLAIIQTAIALISFVVARATRWLRHRLAPVRFESA